MQARRSRTAFLSFAAAIATVALAVNAASCAASGQGGTPSSDDASADGAGPAGDATTDSSTGNQDTGSPESCDGDTMTDPSNCGSCGNKCPSGNTCSCGMCTPPCKGALTPCCGQCVDVTTDPNNCGTCGNACSPPSGGIAVCSNAACSFTCANDAGAADGGGPVVECAPDSGTPGCFDLTSSAAACGACGHACTGTDICIQSTCCAAGDGLCGGACTPLDTATNCGACGKACPSPATCAGGVCSGYVTSNPTVPFIDACSLPGHTTVLVNASSQWTTVKPFPLPFPFPFFGTSETSIWIGNEGTVGFSPNANAFGYPDCTAGLDPFTGYAAAVVFGDAELATGPLGVCYGSTGGGDAGDAGGPEQFVVTWEEATDLTDPGSVLTFSLVLTQGTNTLDFQYGTMIGGGTDGGLDPTVAGGSATVGLQASGSGPDSAVSCATAFIPSTPYDVRFSTP